jgi:hypothetical protein
MIGNTSGFPVGIPLGVYAWLWSRNLEMPTRVRRQPLGPVYARDGRRRGLSPSRALADMGQTGESRCVKCPHPKGTRRG